MIWIRTRIAIKGRWGYGELGVKGWALQKLRRCFSVQYATVLHVWNPRYSEYIVYIRWTPRGRP